MPITIDTFFDEATFTATHVAHDARSRAAAIIDPVWDYDAAAGRLSTSSADAVIDFCRSRDLTVEWILETHVHADHLTSAQYLKERLGGQIAIGARVTETQETFAAIYGEGENFKRDGSQFDHLLEDGERFAIGDIEAQALHTPGHTPTCAVYVIGDAAFVGDTIFMPDFGTARTDFPGGDARTLYRSIQRILSLPPETRIFVGHDYKAPPERTEFAWETTVAEERARNIHVRNGIDEEAFVSMRTERDAKLGAPKLIWPAIQVNMRAGRLPDPDAEGRVFLKIPLNVF